MKSATIQLETLICPSCAQKIEAALKLLEGVEKDSVQISFSSSRARLDFDEEKVTIEVIEDAIDRVGFDVIKSKVK
ncbi:MAG: heavy-metal-associated domain-containing protein [Clostridiaceae bacterium]|nr:heavy-metal-associated domain-containing protein [Clostridiaceae bacterium]